MNLNDKIQPKLDEISKEVYNQLKKNNFVRIDMINKKILLLHLWMH